MFPPDEGPFTLSVNAEDVMKRDGVTARQQNAFPRTTLPMCEDCNGKLNERFERPAKPLVRGLVKGELSLDEQSVRTLALWFLKTWLLLAHPSSLDSEGGLASKRWNLDAVAEDLYGWMISGQTPPNSLSLWLLRVVKRSSGSSRENGIPLPTVVADGRVMKFQSFQFGMDFRAAGFLEVSLVYHPGWEIDHPLEAEQRAVRLWPLVRERALDLAAVPLTESDESHWVEVGTYHFENSAYTLLDRPPLKSVSTLFPLPPGAVRASW